jgi:uncharacterized membrane protein SpoIIM required for sporulation
MNRERYIRLRRDDWAQYEKLLHRLQYTREGQWLAKDVSLMARLYRSICFDLSLVQSREWGSQLEDYLNQLVARGHNFLYRSPRGSVLPSVSFLTTGFPRLLRRHFYALMLSTLLFAGPLLACTFLAAVFPEQTAYLVDQEVLQQSIEMFSPSEYRRDGQNFFSERSYMFGFYVNNNTGIAFRAFSLGALAGLGTAYVLVSNGISIGLTQGSMLAVGGQTRNNFFSFVITHGALELTAIVIAGAAGFVLAQGIVVPGNRSRLDALQYSGRQALRIALGAGAMLLAAAFVEAYFSPSQIPPAAKYLTGAVTWALVLSWLAFSGRGGSSDES